MYLALPPCLSLHALFYVLLFALGGTLLVARGNVPLRQLGLEAPWLPCGAPTVFHVACLPRC